MHLGNMFLKSSIAMPHATTLTNLLTITCYLPVSCLLTYCINFTNFCYRWVRSSTVVFVVNARATIYLNFLKYVHLYSINKVAMHVNEQIIKK